MDWSMSWQLLLSLGFIFIALTAFLKGHKTQTAKVDSSRQVIYQSSDIKRNQVAKERQKKTIKEKSLTKAHAPSPFGQLQERTYCVAVLRCHTEQVTCFAFHPKKRSLVSCSSDRSVRIWWDPVDKQAKFSSVNLFTLAASKEKVKFPDSAEACCWSKEGQSILFALSHTRAIRSFDVSADCKVVPGSLDVISPQEKSFKCIEIDPRCRYFITSDDSSAFVVWDMRGRILTSVDTHQVKSNQVVISPNGRFIASAGFIGEVYLWEILFHRGSNEFVGINKVMDLKGHRAGVNGISFSQDGRKIATVCKDRTLRVFNIDVKYQLEEDAKVLFFLEPWDSQVDLLQVAFSPDDNILAVAGNDSVAFYSLETREIVTILRGCTGHGAIDIHKFGFSGDGTLLATLGQGQSWISLWNVPYMPSISNLQR